MHIEDTKMPTEAKIQEWKKKHKAVHKLTIGDKVCFLHNPNRKTLSLAMTRFAKNDIVGGTEAILENCWLGGDTEIKTDDELFVAAMGKVGDLIQVADSELEKL